MDMKTDQELGGDGDIEGEENEEAHEFIRGTLVALSSTCRRCLASMLALLPSRMVGGSPRAQSRSAQDTLSFSFGVCHSRTL